MSATLDATPVVPVDAHGARRRPAPIPTARLLRVELAKMFDTRSGFWLVVAIAAGAVLATAAVILLAPDGQITYGSFAQAVGIPMTLILPMLGVLLVTSEWSQRSGLTTFTLVPSRNRVVAAKGMVAVAVGAVSILLALGVGALGNLLGSAIIGVDPVWDIPAGQVATLVLANAVNLLLGFTLAVLVRSSPAAIVGYVAITFVLPPLSILLGTLQQWWADLGPWLDLKQAQGALYEGGLTGEQWAQLGTASLLWLALPLAVGLVTIRRAEVK